MNPFEADVRDTLTRHGLKLTAQYGSSGYWIDFAVQHPVQPGRYILAIECDGATYHSSHSARDRDRLRQEQLERQGWRFHRIWSSEWFSNKETCAAKAIAAYQQAVRTADEQPATPAVPAARSQSPQVPTMSPQRSGNRPQIIPGQPIDAYSDAQLQGLARWIRSDDIFRTEDEILHEMMRELGFQRAAKTSSPASPQPSPAHDPRTGSSPIRLSRTISAPALALCDRSST